MLRGVLGDLGVDGTELISFVELFLLGELDSLLKGDLRDLILGFLDLVAFPDGVFFPLGVENRFFEDFLRLFEVPRESVLGFFGLESNKEDPENIEGVSTEK